MSKLDYFYKDLSISDRQKIFRYMKTEISQTMMKYFTEKESGFPSFRSCGFTEDQIKLIWEQNFYEKLCTVNQIMETNERPPLFSDPSDSYRSAKEYFDLMEETGDGSVSPEEQI